jgi:hypothetical protein
MSDQNRAAMEVSSFEDFVDVFSALRVKLPAGAAGSLRDSPQENTLSLPLRFGM